MQPSTDAPEPCEDLDLVNLVGKYLTFMVETHNELSLLEHLQSCKNCRISVIRAIESGEPVPPVWGGLFTPESGIPDAPQLDDYDGPAEFLDARIAWRMRRLSVILRDAELELKDLRERIRDKE